MADSNSAPGSPKQDGLFADRPLPAAPEAFRDIGAGNEQPARSDGASSSPPSKSPVRWIVPLVLFAVIIGGIAWLVQNMPSWRSKPAADTVAEPTGPEILLKIAGPANRGVYLALWDGMPAEKVQDEKQLYAREFEREAQGRYDFAVKLHPELPVELGVTKKSCDCAHLHVAVVSESECSRLFAQIMKGPSPEIEENPSWDWKPLEKTEEHGVKLPVGAHVIVRMIWKNKRTIGEPLNLGATIWARTPSMARKQDYGLRIDAVSAAPLRTKKELVDVGIIEPGNSVVGEFVVWSPTRDQAKFKMSQDDPLFEVAAKQFTPDECADLQKKLRKEEINTRVRSAWTVKVRVHEQKGKSQLDQGYFRRAVQIDMPDGAEDLPSLVVTGIVKSEFVIGAQNDQGKINLGPFQAAFGTRKTVVVTAQTSTELDPSAIVHPAGLKVQVVETAKRKWNLLVEVPPNRFSGEITDDNLVILRTKAGRSIRIPLMGHAVQG
jgi:hypothetical protein